MTQNPGRAASCLLLLCAGWLAACEPGRDHAAAPKTAPAVETFVERARESGLDFVHFNGMSGERYFCEAIGAGSALFDYDNDGDLDVYLVQGQMLGPKDISQAKVPTDPATLRDRLFRSELVETGRLHFVDVTEQSGIDSRGYGMGVAAGDIDDDGWVDLYVTRLGRNLLLRNLGNGRFADITETSGTEIGQWSASAAFLDYDRDGRLDLFVTNYVDYSVDNDVKCYADTSVPDYCSPLTYRPLPDRLFRNLGDGRFDDVTADSQVARHYGSGFGVAVADFNSDGWIDAYVANDLRPNQLWINQGDGTFREAAMLGGCALNENGKAEAGMGVDAGDFDNDGDEDIFLSHLTGETNTVFLNVGDELFEDYSVETGLGPPSRPYTGFGTAWFDYDNDGWLDVFVTTGAVRVIAELVRQGDPFPLHQKDQLYHNRGDGGFDSVGATSGSVFSLSEVGRGAAFGDVDNDGDPDILVTNNSGPVRLMINQVGQERHWLGLRLLRRSGLSDDPGAWAEILRPGGKPLRRRVRVDGSFLNANDPRVLVGLGSEAAPCGVRVHWNDGSVEEWDGIEADRYTVLRQGTGKSAAP